MKHLYNTYLHKYRHSLLLLTVVSVALCTVAGCKKSRSAERPTLTVSIEPLRYFVEQIAGDRYHVTTLVKAGSSPETYEPTPAQLVELSDSKGYLRMGNLPFETTWLQRLVETAPNLPVADVAKGVPVISDHNEPDLHVWTSPQNAAIIARNIAAFLIQTDTAGREYYEQRLAAFETRVDSLDAAIKSELANLQHRTFAIYHPELAYFAKSYGLVQVPIEQHGREPGVGYMAALVNRCRRDSVRVILMQKEYPPANAQTLARETGAKVVEINPLSHDWPGEMIRTAKALRNE